MGLRDQLLKAGLVSKKKAKQTEKETKKQEHQAKKGDVKAVEVEKQKQQELERLEKEKQEKYLADKKRNEEIYQSQRAREVIYRIHQIIKSNRIYDREQEVPYYFPISQTKIIRLMVSTYIRESLARGKMGIVYASLTEEYMIIPSYTAKLIASLDSSVFLILHSDIHYLEEISEEFIAHEKPYAFILKNEENF